MDVPKVYVKRACRELARKGELARIGWKIIALPELLQKETLYYYIATKFDDSLFLSHSSALEFHLRERISFPNVHVTSDGSFYRAVRKLSDEVVVHIHPPPSNLLLMNKGRWGVCKCFSVEGYPLALTVPERTAVDLIKAAKTPQALLEVSPFLFRLRDLEPEKMCEYALLHENSTLAAKVGFFFSTYHPVFKKSGVFKRLKCRLPEHPHYFFRSFRKESVLIKEWNILFPESLVEAFKQREREGM